MLSAAATSFMSNPRRLGAGSNFYRRNLLLHQASSEPPLNQRQSDSGPNIQVTKKQMSWRNTLLLLATSVVLAAGATAIIRIIMHLLF
jgi:hypothetical protein